VSQFVRENTRYPVELAVRVRCETWSDYLDLYTTNLSSGGVFVASKVSAPIGTELAVQLSLPNGTAIELRAEVVHLTGEEELAQGRPQGMGLMFLALDDETRRAVEAMVTVARFTTRNAPPAPPAAEPPPAAAPSEETTHARKARFGDVVEQSLFNELARLVALAPHEQLGVEKDASRDEIDQAYRRLAERYQPAIFMRYGPATQEVLKKINDLLLGARTLLLDPAQPAAPLGPEAEEQMARGEEARRALKASIERRIEDACRHRDLGDLEEAIRGFEAVLALDRKNDYARLELRALHEKREQKDAPKAPSLIDRLLKR
jgi:uncharacterized protein (TIGR02266 family)